MSDATEPRTLAGGLVAATPYGVGAFLAGLGLAYAFVLRSPDVPTTIDGAAVVLAVLHVFVRDDAGTWFVDGAGPGAVVLLAVPAVPLLLAGLSHARPEDGDDVLAAPDAARRGAAIAVSYALLLALSAALFETRFGGSGFPPSESVAVALDPLSVGAAGLLVGAAFGGAGGVLAHRASDVATIVALFVPAVIALVLILG